MRETGGELALLLSTYGTLIICPRIPSKAENRILFTNSSLALTDVPHAHIISIITWWLLVVTGNQSSYKRIR